MNNHSTYSTTGIKVALPPDFQRSLPVRGKKHLTHHLNLAAAAGKRGAVAAATEKVRFSPPKSPALAQFIVSNMRKTYSFPSELSITIVYQSERVDQKIH